MASGTQPQPFSSSLFKKVVFTVFENESLDPQSQKYKWVNFDTQPGYAPIAVALESTDLVSFPKFHDSLENTNLLCSGTIVVKNLSTIASITTTVMAVVTYVKIG